MIDFSGWIFLSDSTVESELVEVERCVSELRCRIEELNLSSSCFRFENPGGQPVLLLSGMANRRRAEHDDFDAFLARLARDLPGSWGVIYWRDDESETGNAYRVIRVSRGAVTIHDDVLLSPCNPVIED
jgi:hypothetical protein